MSLKDLREGYLSGGMSKPDYISRVQEVLAALEDVRAFMRDTDLTNVAISGGEWA